jgi:hypothetical protein
MMEEDHRLLERRPGESNGPRCVRAVDVDGNKALVREDDPKMQRSHCVHALKNLRA